MYYLLHVLNKEKTIQNDYRLLLFHRMLYIKSGLYYTLPRQPNQSINMKKYIYTDGDALTPGSFYSVF